MNSESERLCTFVDWNVPFIKKETLALYGFFFKSAPDTVQCHFCGVELSMWEDGDDVLIDHIRCSPTCQFLKNHRQQDNIPININILDETLPISTDVTGLFDILDIQPIIGPDYTIQANRIATYTNWPNIFPQRPTELSGAGFYYTGEGDKLVCFSCGVCLFHWEYTDDPWEQHIIYSSNCEYVKLMKEDEYITTVLTKVVLPTSCNDIKTPLTTSTETNNSDKSSCKICLINECETIFLPCKHAMTCKSCAMSIRYCPVCRVRCRSIMKIYIC